MTTAIDITNLQIQILTDSGRSAEELSTLIHQIYEAVAEPQNWPRVVGAIAQSMSAQQGLLFTPYMRPQEGGFLFPWMIQESHLQLWGSKYIEHDIWAKSIVEKDLWHEGGVLTDEQIVPRDVFAQSVFYSEFLSTMNIGRVCAGIVLGGAPGLPATSLSVFRSFDAPAFSSTDIAWYQLLIPHLSRALGLLHRLDALHVQNQSLLAAFDRLEFGACLLDETGRVLHMNPSASTVLERGDGLSIDKQNYLSGMSLAKLSGKSPESLNDWIAKQIASATLMSRQTAHFSNAFLQMRTEPGKHYALQCSLLPTSFKNMTHRTARMIVFITDPDAVQLPTIERLVDLYKLTPSQARVARELSIGNSYKEIGQTLGISESTVATHVKEVYSKVKVNRQADLMRHIMALGKASV
jgi:DNA-binding CsgD family transcriptional regulator